MANDPKGGFTALNRFGFGARGDGDLAAAASDPRGFLLSEIGQPGIALLDGPGLGATPGLLVGLFDEQERRRVEREGADRTKLATALQLVQGAEAPQPEQAAMSGGPAQPPKSPPSIEQTAYRAEALARFQRAAAARAGFVERLVCFWSNHFCISVAKGGFVRVIAGAYEREAIRPHVLGRFADMLKAVELHPAMIFYLDNQQSMGPNSQAGKNRRRGLNENLAREILELHTLGVDGGYSQADVTSLARIITGWSFVGRDGRIGPPGSAAFVANFHEPGAQDVLGRAYVQPDRTQGLAVLDDLVRHPATARHIATKFARHFVADDPPPALVDRLARNFRDTDGDLKSMATTLVESPEAWTIPPGKLRSPYEFLIAAARGTGRAPTDPGPILGGLNTLGQPLWSPTGPNGYSDTAATWISPEGVKARLDLSWQFASRIADMPNPVDTLDKIAGAAASADTRQAIARAESKQQALALLLMSPEMQRR
ncbi:MAG: DUF1800 family protein [Beijerinckiaceae bacterium]